MALPAGVLLGFPCQVDAQCSLRVPNSACVQGYCRCGATYVPYRRNNCLRGKASPPGHGKLVAELTGSMTSSLSVARYCTASFWCVSLSERTLERNEDNAWWPSRFILRMSISPPSISLTPACEYNPINGKIDVPSIAKLTVKLYERFLWRSLHHKLVARSVNEQHGFNVTITRASLWTHGRTSQRSLHQHKCVNPWEKITAFTLQTLSVKPWEDIAAFTPPTRVHCRLWRSK